MNQQMAISQIAQTVAKIVDLRERGRSINEANTKRTIIEPIIRALGWDTDSLDEVENEYRNHPRDNPVDYALLIDARPVLFVEAKPLRESLDDRKWITQTISYAAVAGIDWCVLTNGAKWRIYKVNESVDAEKKLFREIDIEFVSPEEALETLSLLTRDNMGERHIDAVWREEKIDKAVYGKLKALLSNDDHLVSMLRPHLLDIIESDLRGALRRIAVRVDSRSRYAKGEVPDQPELPVDEASNGEGASTESPCTIEAGGAVSMAASEPALGRRSSPRARLILADIGIPNGAVLTNIYDPSITCTVRDASRNLVLFGDQELSLSRAAEAAYTKLGRRRSSGAFQGGRYWCYEGTRIVGN